MPRITPVDPSNAQGQAKELLDAVQKKLGMAPNIMRTMAQSPAVLQAYLGFSEALGGTKISAGLREQLANAIAGFNGCAYCAAAHTALGKMAGVDVDELKRNIRGESSDPKTQAAIDFARAIVEKRGWASDEDVKAFRDAGFGEAEVAEVIAIVSINIFTNYFNHIAKTEIDFPKVEVPEPALA